MTNGDQKDPANWPKFVHPAAVPETLEPCPFEHDVKLGLKEFAYSAGTSDEDHIVQCLDCAAIGGGGETQAAAREKWNRRAPKARMDESHSQQNEHAGEQIEGTHEQTHGADVPAVSDDRPSSGRPAVSPAPSPMEGMPEEPTFVKALRMTTGGLPETQMACVITYIAALRQRAERLQHQADTYRTKAHRRSEIIGELQSALTAEREERGKDAEYINRLSCDLVSAGNEIAAERQKAEGLARDAERYRWLRDVGDVTWTPFCKRPHSSIQSIDDWIDDGIAARSRQGADNE